MGETGFDCCIKGQWARSQILSMTLNYDISFIDGDVYENMEFAGLLATSEVAA